MSALCDRRRNVRWICDKNDASDAEFVIFKDSIDEVLTNYTKEFDADKVKQFKECLFGQKSVLNEIFDVYMRILKGLDDSDEEKNEGVRGIKLENKKNKVKDKNIIKNNLEENVKDSVFRLGNKDRNRGVM
ncbi:unnamed protein product [Rhizophagus irregularis]|nr:unnamed protein product [Rhizophagus irregularis]